MMLLLFISSSYILVSDVNAQLPQCMNGGVAPAFPGLGCDPSLGPLVDSTNPNGEEVCCDPSKIVQSVTTVPTMTTMSIGCMDLVNPRTGVSDCPRLQRLCNDNNYMTLMTQQCPRTCGRCNGGIGGMTTTRRGGLGGVTTTRFGGGGLGTTPIFGGGVGSCVDQINPRTGTSDCLQRRSLCTDPRYQDLMRTQCPATCGFPCNGGIGSMTSTTRRRTTRQIGTQTTTTQFGCFDMISPGKTVSDCQRFASRCTDPIYQALMHQVCCRTCSGGGAFTTQFGQTTTNPFGQTTTNPFGQTTMNPFGQTTAPFLGKKK